LEAQKQRHRAKFPEPGANSPLCFRTQGAQRRDLGLRTPARAETQKLGSGARCPVGGDPSAQRGAGFPEQGYGARGCAVGSADQVCQVLPVPQAGPMGEGDPGVEPEPRKNTAPPHTAQSSQNKPKPAPDAGCILGAKELRPLLEGRPGARDPLPGGLRPLPRSDSPLHSYAQFFVFFFFFYRFGFLLGREVVVESLGLLPARHGGGLGPRPGFAGLAGLPGFHARARNGRAGACGAAAGTRSPRSPRCWAAEGEGDASQAKEGDRRRRGRRA
jgi:hypothetical protein